MSRAGRGKTRSAEPTLRYVEISKASADALVGLEQAIERGKMEYNSTILALIREHAEIAQGGVTFKGLDLSGEKPRLTFLVDPIKRG